jgi:hypothetical protein
MTEDKAEKNIKRLSTAQLYVLYVGAYYKLRRSSMGWWAVNHPRWGVTELRRIFSPATVKSLWGMGLLDGVPDEAISGKAPCVQPELWTNDRGKKLLDTINCDTGILFDITNDQLVVPGLEQEGSPSVAVH